MNRPDQARANTARSGARSAVQNQLSWWGVLLAVVGIVAWFAWLSPAAFAQSAWDQPKLDEIELPANYPAFSATARLQPFWVSATSPYEFAVDASSIQRVSENAIHATLVVTSSQGVRNVWVVGLRCNRSEKKLVATARPDGSWVSAAGSTWRPLSSAGPVNQAEKVLAQTLCLGSTTNSDPRDALRRLAATFTESKH
jgi:CNP1-like family